MDVGTIIGILATAAVVWLFIRPSKSGAREAARAKMTVSSPAASKIARAAEQGEFHWPPLGDFEFEVVGESNYQAAIAAVAGDHGGEQADQECVAALVPEDDNRFDSKAVAVLINGRTVGYLSRNDARSFRRRLGQKGLGGAITTCAACVVGGGTRRNGEKLSYGVRLDIKPFE